MSLEPLWKSLGDPGEPPTRSVTIRSLTTTIRLAIPVTLIVEDGDEDEAVERLTNHLIEYIPIDGDGFEVGEVAP
jgi:hypothetical protein